MADVNDIIKFGVEIFVPLAANVAVLKYALKRLEKSVDNMSKKVDEMQGQINNLDKNYAVAAYQLNDLEERQDNMDKFVLSNYNSFNRDMGD